MQPEAHPMRAEAEALEAESALPSSPKGTWCQARNRQGKKHRVGTREDETAAKIMLWVGMDG